MCVGVDVCGGVCGWVCGLVVCTSTHVPLILLSCVSFPPVSGYWTLSLFAPPLNFNQYSGPPAEQSVYLTGGGNGML